MKLQIRNGVKFGRRKIELTDTFPSVYQEWKQQKSKGNTKGFVACNARATNEFKEKESLAYVVNRFMNPHEKKFFSVRGIEVNEDMYALSELIQWIWRSRIRKGKAINLYIPSKRMRSILEEYLLNDM